MSKINEIQAAILELEGGAYQKLVDQYLHRRYHFKNIQPLGVQNGTNKSTKGIPDAYVIDGERYILICYGTVKNQPVNKIKQDIEDCLNEAKTSLDASKISKIICCYTSSNITLKQSESLLNCANGIEVELVSLGTLSYDLANNYRTLATDHLQISLDTHQIFEVDDFVTNYDKSETSAPVGTIFSQRKEELERIVDSVENNNITILSGPSGIGKTRLALEVCRLYEKQGWKVFCIRSNGALLYDDIEDYLCEQENYLLLFDDANTVTQLGNVIEECFGLEKPNQMRVLLTIRDYAKKQVIFEAQKQSGFMEIPVGELGDEEIKGILKENYNIVNQLYLDRICQVSKGNVRLAVLAGLRAIESGMPAISNAEDIFKNYYDPILDRIGLNKQEIILLGLISFFGAVRTKEDDFFIDLISKYLQNINISDSIEKLFNCELVDWFEKEIVKISDQSMGNYILYLTVYEKKWIDLCDLIEQSIPHRTKLIVNLLDMLLNLFGSAELSSTIKNCVDESWNKAEKEKQRIYLEVFYPVNPIKGLVYLKEFVESTIEENYDIKLLDFDSAKKTNRINTKEIEILAGYKHTDCFEEAVSLLFLLFEKRPALFMDFYFAITNSLLFDKYSYRNGYIYERKFMDLLWKKCRNGEDLNFSMLFLRVSENALETEYTYLAKNRNRTVSFVRMQVLVNDELKVLRARIWNAITGLYEMPAYQPLANKILRTIHVNGLYEAEYRDLCYADFNELCPFLTSMVPMPFEKAVILGSYRDAFVQLNLQIDERFAALESCDEYRIFSVLSKEYYKDCSYEESEKKRRQEIEKIASEYSEENIGTLFSVCSLINQTIDENSWAIKTGIETIFSVLDKDAKILREAVKQYLLHGAPYSVRATQPVSTLLNQYGYDETKRLIVESIRKRSTEWYAELLITVPEKITSECIANDYFLYQRSEFVKTEHIVIPLRYISKFLKFNPRFFDEINNFLLHHPDNIAWFLGNAHDADEVQKISKAYLDCEDVLTDLYFTCDYSLFDYEKLLFWELYKVNPFLVWEKYVRLIVDERKHRQEERVFSQIWSLPEYLERIDYAFTIFADEMLFDNSIFRVLIACTKADPLEERKKKWILNKMHESIGNIGIVNKLLDGVEAVYPAWKVDVIVEYLNLDRSVEHLKELHILPMMESWSGSEIPIINRRIDTIKSVRDSLHGIDYIEHKEYLNMQIGDLEKHREFVKKQEYLEESTLEF